MKRINLDVLVSKKANHAVQNVFVDTAAIKRNVVPVPSLPYVTVDQKLKIKIM